MMWKVQKRNHAWQIAQPWVAERVTPAEFRALSDEQLALCYWERAEAEAECLERNLSDLMRLKRNVRDFEKAVAGQQERVPEDYKRQRGLLPEQEDPLIAEDRPS